MNYLKLAHEKEESILTTVKNLKVVEITRTEDSGFHLVLEDGRVLEFTGNCYGSCSLYLKKENM